MFLAQFSCHLSVRNKDESVFRSLLYCCKEMRDKQGNGSLLLVPVHQPACADVCTSIFLFVCF